MKFKDTKSMIKQLMRVLITNDFKLIRFHTVTPNTFVLLVEKLDILGASLRYGMILSSSNPCTPEVKTGLGYVAAQRFHPIQICTGVSQSPDSISYDEIVKILGGPLSEPILFRDDLPDALDQLGHNQVPKGLTGKAYDILENAVKDCLQYLLANKALCYGQRRRFEKLPDGIAFSRGNFVLLYDSKAYKKHFDVKSDDIRRFSTYVKDFNGRYAEYIGPIFCFLVVSGEFAQNQISMNNYADEYYALCQTKLCFMRTRELGTSVMKVKRQHKSRIAINWRNILSKSVFTLRDVEKELKRIAADKIY